MPHERWGIVVLGSVPTDDTRYIRRGSPGTNIPRTPSECDKETGNAANSHHEYHHCEFHRRRLLKDDVIIPSDNTVESTIARVAPSRSFGEPGSAVAGGLASLVTHYENLMKPFLCPGQAFPVILVADNDSGAKEIKSRAKKLVGRAVDGKEEFYHLVKNLYLVLLPRPCGEDEVEIEDYFDEDVRRRKVGGKSFMSGDKFDEEKGYGKHIFAESVVRPGQGDIEFAKFRGLLMRIDKAIQNYAKVCQGR